MLKALVSSWFEFNQSVSIEKWDTIEKMTTELSTLANRRVRWYLKNNREVLESLQLWSYVFSGDYTPSSFVEAINRWPSRSFTKVTILEGWSIYDIDEYLVKKGYIQAWEYISYVSDKKNIDVWAKKYPFVQEFVSTKPTNSVDVSLEWILYPDTYHLNIDQPIVSQLVNVQLQTFRDKVMSKLEDKLNAFASSLSSAWYSFSLSLYNIITLASIVEKEERYDANKPIIAGIFLNRIENNMRIDADITLCYGLKKGYEICTPALIGQSIGDENNIYNTRRKSGLTPTPIANPSIVTIESVLNFKKTDNLFYLHDKNGKIWTSQNLEWHNVNKNTYL